MRVPGQKAVPRKCVIRGLKKLIQRPGSEEWLGWD
jgi:hypothetical protein